MCLLGTYFASVLRLRIANRRTCADVASGLSIRYAKLRSANGPERYFARHAPEDCHTVPRPATEAF